MINLPQQNFEIEDFQIFMRNFGTHTHANNY